MTLVSKTLLVHLSQLASDPSFPDLWAHVLTVLQVRLPPCSHRLHALGRCLQIVRLCH